MRELIFTVFVGFCVQKTEEKTYKNIYAIRSYARAAMEPKPPKTKHHKKLNIQLNLCKFFSSFFFSFSLNSCAVDSEIKSHTENL